MGTSGGNTWQSTPRSRPVLRPNFERRAVDFRKLKPDDIRRFLSSQSGLGSSPSWASHLALTLRGYLRYRATRGDEVGKLSAVILNPVHWKLASLPRALKPEKVSTSSTRLQAPAAGQSVAMRLSVSLDMGLRYGEIA